MTSVGGNALQVRDNITFFQVTSKVTHYFWIYKKISELLFQKSNSLLFSHLLTDSALCEHDTVDID